MGLFDNLFGVRRVAHDVEILQAVEWAVDRVEPRLRQFGNYPDVYLAPVERAVAYAQSLAAKVPGPVSITPEAYSTNPVVHALFPTPEHLHEAFESSRAIRDFQREHPDIGEMYALVCMRRNIKDMYGMELQGEILRRDVHQSALYFSDYTMVDPGLTEAESRRCIAQGFFESLVAHVANRIEARKQAYARDEVERDEWLSRLRTAAPEQRGELQAGLDTVLRRLSDAVSSLELANYARDFDAVLSNPESHLYLERAEMNLDSMGIVRDHGADGCDEVDFCDLVGRDRRRWTVTMVYCNHVKSRASITDKLDKAERWLGVLNNGCAFSKGKP